MYIQGDLDNYNI